MTAIRSGAARTVEHASTIGRKSVRSAAILVQASCCHTIWPCHANPVARLNGRHRCGRHCRRTQPWRCRNSGLQVRRARRRIDARQTRNGVGPGAERSAQQ
jgi:hypothetical protein